MKKIVVLSLVFIFMFSATAHALSWAIPFVVWDGNVYEVKLEEIIEEKNIGKNIGQVKTIPNDMTGEYYGDASNHYAKGTKYYAIQELSTSSAIAVEDGNQWVKAVYIHKAPFHILNLLFNKYFIFTVILIAVVLIGFFLRNRQLKTQ